MQLVNLSSTVSLKSKLICFDLNKVLISKLIKKYDLGDNIKYICDNNPKLFGTTSISEREYSVVSVAILNEIDLSEYDIIITTPFRNAAFEQLKTQSRVSACCDTVYYYIDSDLEREKEYRKKYAESPLENIIVFRSGPMKHQYVEGTDFYDNSRALFEYMLENGYNRKYELIWLVKDPGKYSFRFDYPNVKFLSFDWDYEGTREQQDEYYRALCLAKYIFFTDTYGFALNSRPDQIRVQLWHGCGFKTRVGFSSCENKYDLTTVVSPMYKEIHKKIYGLRDDQVIITGYAKHDWLFKPYDGSFEALLNIKPSRKYVFWLPTFRIADDRLSNLNQYEINPDTGLPVVEYESQLEVLNDILASYDTSLIIKLHPFQKDSLVLDKKLSNIRVIKNSELAEKDLIINRLLASADALISDYSSAAVDFLNTDRPIGFTLDDVTEYENSRGFVFDNITEMIPGKEIYSFADMCDFIKEIAEGVDSSKKKRNRVAKEMLSYRDSDNCSRICQALNITK